MNKRRHFLNFAALILPAIAFSAIVLYFLHLAVPRIRESEARRVEAASRDMATTLKANKCARDFVWKYGQGVILGDESFAARFPKTMTWKMWNPRGGTKKADKMWGVIELEATKGLLVGGKRIIWARDKKLVRGKVCEIGELNYALLLWTAGGCAIFIIAGLSLFTIFKLVSYAQSRDEFMMSTAHDLNMPLMGLRFTIGQNDAEAKNICERLFRLVENIREFMHMGGKRRFRLEEVDLFAAYQEAYGVFELDFKDVFGEKGLEATGEKSLRVIADETALVQIFWNILANELKYASQFGKVKVVISREGANAKVVISDEGPGMTRREMRRAFRRYWRGAKGFSKGGFGIGLCVAREFAVGMNGSLSLSPSPEGGVAFTLRLPLCEQWA